MNNYLLSEAIGDISGMPYEFRERTKNYAAVNLLHPHNDYTDDTVCTFACADALLHNLDMAKTLRKRCRDDFNRGYGGRFFNWIIADELEKPYFSYGNGSAMRVSAAGFLATTPDECIDLARLTAAPTHNHPEGIKGAVATALVIFHALRGESKEWIRSNILKLYYPDWYMYSYDYIKRDYDFDETCQRTVPAAIITFLESNSYEDCLKLAISLGGDADTLGAISGPMAYAYYKEMPEELIKNAKAKLPQWMLELCEEFDVEVNRRLAVKKNQTTYTYKYPRPAVTADCMVITREQPQRILLIQRGNEPYKGMWALPGGFMNMDETAEQCARRELEEETGLKVNELQQIGAYTAVDRDPRGRTVSVAYLTVMDTAAEVEGGDDAARAEWFPISELPELAFDHGEIIRDGLSLLKRL